MYTFKMIVVSVTIFGLFAESINGQDSETSLSNEIYLTGTVFNYNGFGLQYKSQKRKETFLRIGFNNISANFNKRNIDYTSNGNPTLSTNFRGKFEIGIEKRKAITDKLSAFYGINCLLGYSFTRNKTENPALPKNLRSLDAYEIYPGLGLNSGLILNIKNSFSIAAEITPEISYSYKSHQSILAMTKIKETQNSGLISIDNEIVRISLIYHWTKK